MSISAIASSTIVALFESASAIPSATPSPQSNNNQNGMQKGANYFFGFLITFIALLLIFVGCGVGTRRRLLVRRGLMADWEIQDAAVVPQKEPLFIEPWLDKGGQTWSSMTPLSATATRPPSKSPSPSLHIAPLSTTSRFRQFAQYAHWPFQGPHARAVEASKDAASSESNIPPENLQVTVMIAMPSPNKLEMEKPPIEQEDPIPEYSFGVTQVDWRGKDWMKSS